MKSIIRTVLSAVLVMSCAGTVSAQTAAGEPAGGEASASAPATIPATIMFSIDELNEIQSRVATTADDGARGRNPDAIERASLYLSTIVYYGPKDWTIWVNGLPISPGQDFQSFQITDIGPRFVELLVPLSAQGMRPVRLEPNQSFIVKSGAVVEGPW
jgi:hypothetical protein